jgi:DNA-binding MarR family transcriptional regulator
MIARQLGLDLYVRLSLLDKCLIGYIQCIGTIYSPEISQIAQQLGVDPEKITNALERLAQFRMVVRVSELQSIQ